MRSGILGGTFDPVHNGHIALAEQTADALRLDRVLFIPNASPPHKTPGRISPYRHRVHMLQLALKDRPLLELCELETEEDRPNYTVDTIQKLKETYEDDLFFIIGSDELPYLPQWKRPEAILNSVTVVVVSRAGCPALSVEAVENTLGREAAENLCRNMLRLDVPDISSTSIREDVKNGLKISVVVHPDVARYIADNNLY